MAGGGISLSDIGSFLRERYGLASQTPFCVDGDFIVVFVATETIPAGLLDHLEKVLEPGEQDRALTFAYASDKRDYVVAHALVRLIAIAVGLAAPGLCLVQEMPGMKPVFRCGSHGPLPDVSLSHTRGGVAVGFCRNGQIGVDIEPRRRHEFAERSRLFCSPLESRRADQAAHAGMVDYFARLWTLKEAVLKAAGLGLSYDPRDVKVDPFRMTFRDRAGTLHKQSSWQLHQCSPDGNHILAAAIRKPVNPTLNKQMRTH